MVSVIIAVKNGALTLEKAIVSIIEQDYSDKEIIIIDGVSVDGTCAIIEKFRNYIKYFVSEPDNGIYDAMNKGIKASVGEWIYFLGSDDILYEKNTLSMIFGNDLSIADVVYGNVKFKRSGEIYCGEIDYDKLCIISPCHQAVFYRRHLFDRFGLFDTNFKTASDYIMHVKTFCSGVKWKYFDQIIAEYNEDGISSGSTKDKIYQNQLFSFCFDNFHGKISDLTLSRIFYSAFPPYFLSHKLSESIRYLRLTIKEVGLFRLILNFFILLYRYKVIHAQDQ